MLIGDGLRSIASTEKGFFSLTEGQLKLTVWTALIDFALKDWMALLVKIVIE